MKTKIRMDEFQRRFNHVYEGLFEIQQGSDDQYILFSTNEMKGKLELNDIAPDSEIGSDEMREIFDMVSSKKNRDFFPFRGELAIRRQNFEELLGVIGVRVELEAVSANEDEGQLRLFTPLGEEIATMVVQNSDTEPTEYEDLNLAVLEQSIGMGLAKAELDGAEGVADRIDFLADLSPIISLEGTRAAKEYQQNRLSDESRLTAERVESFFKDEFPEQVVVVEEDADMRGFSGLASTLHVFREGKPPVEIPFFVRPGGEGQEVAVGYKAAKLAIDTAGELGGDEKASTLKEALFDYEDGEQDRERFEDEYEGGRDGQEIEEGE